MRRNDFSTLVCVAAIATGLSGCDTTRSVIGLDKQVPDEFAVVSRAPLSVPPDFGLRPPMPGADRPQEKSVRSKARNILLRNSRYNQADAAREAVKSGRFSPGEAAVLTRAGALNVDPTIRRTVNQESTAIADASQSFLDKVVFWQEADKPGEIVDPDKESRRIREARALGDAPSKGEVPVIQRKTRGLLEGIF